MRNKQVKEMKILRIIFFLSILISVGCQSSGQVTVNPESSELKNSLFGTWQLHSTSSYGPPTPDAKEIRFFEDGTFESTYEGLGLTLLRAYLGDSSVGPKVKGVYAVSGRWYGDLGIHKNHISMTYGPRNRVLKIDGKALTLGKFGDSYRELTYNKVD